MIDGLGQVVVDKLREIPDSMAQDELAYLALTGKVELPICNKLAWLLQLWARSLNLAVTREWARESGKHADIAVLRGSEPQALLELKAMVTFDILRETGTRDRFLRSLKNDMDRWSDYEGVEILGILLATHLKNAVPVELVNSKIVKYADSYPRALGKWKTESAVKSECDSRINRFFQGFGIQPITIHAGRYFETDVEVLAWLISRA